MLEHLDQLKAKLDAARPLPEALERNLREDWLLRWTYHSNAIEGNTLTLLETKVVLEGITVGGKSLREHFEAINHREAILYVEDLVKQPEPLREFQLKTLHQLVLRNIDDAHAGVYRNINVTIAGARHVPPDHTGVQDQMTRFIEGLARLRQEKHAVAFAAEVHADFVGIHPFVDGNGRTSRLLMNLALMSAGFPPAIISVDQRLAYYEALDAWHVDGAREPFLKLVAAAVATSFDAYFRAIG